MTRSRLFKIGLVAIIAVCGIFIYATLVLAEQARPFVTEEVAPDMEELRDLADFSVHVYTINPETKKGKTTFVDGDKMAVKFKSREAGYVYLFNLDYNGIVHMLYPNKWEKDNKVVKNKYYYLGVDDDFQWRTSADEKGHEYVFAVFCSDIDRQEEFVDRLEDLLEGNFPPQVSDDCREFLRQHARPFITEEAEKDIRYGFGFQEVYLKP